MRLTDALVNYCQHLLIFYINVKNRVYIQVLQTHTSKTPKIRTVNLVVEHIVTTPKCSATKFTVLIFLVFSMCESITLVYKLCFHINICSFSISYRLLGTATATSTISKILKGNAKFWREPCRELLSSFV